MTEIINRVAELRKDIETCKLIDVIEISVELIRIESLLKAINYTHCCESDSEQLVLFADWLQYNGRYSLPKQQAKDFLKEQQEQN